MAEDRYYYFEQAIFQVQQKGDESNDSYMARHDSFFEEMLSRAVTLEEVRAYVLLRHSLLHSDDKKRVVLESKGELKYQDIVKAIRLLGSKLFQELQVRGANTGNRNVDQKKVYEINFVDEESTEEAYAEMMDSDDIDDEIFAHFAEQFDEDAIYVAEFKDQITEALQDSELATVFTAYQEARQRLRDKAEARGYWPPSKGRGRGKGFPGKKGKSDPRRRKTLAERIANSACKICGERGHWKRECPRRESSGSNEVMHYAQEDDEMPNPTELFSQIPDDAESYEGMSDGHCEEARTPALSEDDLVEGIQNTHVCLYAVAPKVNISQIVRSVIARNLITNVRTPRNSARTASPKTRTTEGRSSECLSERAVLKNSRQPEGQEVVFVLTTGAEGVIDTGASRTVIGDSRVRDLVSGLAPESRAGVKKVPSQVTFRFGNNGTLTSKHALLLPTSAGAWIRIEVIPGSTPLLISNRLLRDIDAVLRVRESVLKVGGSRLPLRLDERGLSIVDLADLFRQPAAEAFHTSTLEQQKHNITAAASENMAKTKETRQKSRVETSRNFNSTDSTTSDTPAEICDNQPRADQPRVTPSISWPPPSASGSHAYHSQGDGQADSGQEPGQPRRTSLGRRGRSPGTGAGGTGRLSQRPVHQASRGDQPPTMGRDDSRRRQTPREENGGCVRDRPNLRNSHGPEVLPEQCGSAWALNFKQYVIARLRSTARAERDQRTAASTTRTQEDEAAKSEKHYWKTNIRQMRQGRMREERSHEEWKLCSQMSSSHQSSGKRNAEVPETMEKHGMQTEISEQTKSEIMVRRAVLMRELAQLDQIEENSGRTNQEYE